MIIGRIHLMVNYNQGEIIYLVIFREQSFINWNLFRWRKRTIIDEIKACEQFIKKERSHTDSNHLPRRNYNYRERSIDDGSHFDPRLDKYPSDSLRRRERSKSIENENIRNDKKISGLEKVGFLLSGIFVKHRNSNLFDL